MTYAQLISKLGIILEDPDQITFTDTNLVDSLQDNIDDIAVETMIFESSVNVNFPVNTAYWRVRDDVPDYYAVTHIFDLNNNRWLIPARFKNIQGAFDKFDTQVGPPVYFAPLDFNTIVLYPTYSVAPAQQMVMYYIATAPTVTHSQTVPLSNRDADTLTNGVASDMLDILLEARKSSIYLEEYLKGKINIRLNKSRKNSGDKFKLMVPRYGNLER